MTTTTSEGDLLALARDQTRDLAATIECASDVLNVALGLLDEANGADASPDQLNAYQLIWQTCRQLRGAVEAAGSHEQVLGRMQEAAA